MSHDIIRTTKAEQEKAGFTSPQSFSEALTRKENLGEKTRRANRILLKRGPSTVLTSDKARQKTKDNLTTLDTDLAGLEQPKEEAKTDIADMFEDDKDEVELSDEERELNNINRQNERDTEAATSSLEGLRTGTRKANDAIIRQLKNTLEQRLVSMQDLNKRTLEGQRIRGITSGRARFAPEVQSGIMSAAESAGIRRLGEIESEGLLLIAQAEKAALLEDFELLNSIMGKRAELNEERTKVLREQIELQKERDTEIAEQKEKVSRQFAIADLFQQGITDPGLILDAINFDEEGEQIGDVTLEEITAVTDELAAKDDLTGTSAEFRTFKQFQPDGDFNDFLRFKRQIAAAGREGRGTRGIDIGGGTEIPEENLQEVIGVLNENRGDDGFVDPFVYEEVFDQWLDLGGTVSKFVKQFPPKDYVNPEATNLPRVIMSRVETGDSLGFDNL